MAIIKRVLNVYLLDWGGLMVFDKDGQQIPELQSTYSIDLHKQILLEGLDNCELTGFNQVPIMWKQEIDRWLNHWKDRGLSFEEIMKETHMIDVSANTLEKWKTGDRKPFLHITTGQKVTVAPSRKKILKWWYELRVTERVVLMNKHGVEAARSSESMTAKEIQDIYESSEVPIKED